MPRNRYTATVRAVERARLAHQDAHLIGVRRRLRAASAANPVSLPPNKQRRAQRRLRARQHTATLPSLSR